MADNISRSPDTAEGAPSRAPEAVNSEQDHDASEQAQSVARESLNRCQATALEESDKVSSGGISDDVQDLVERMKQMQSSGRIDLDSYRGEPNFDDNVDKFGPQAKPDGPTER
jgi:hypothetical protein